MCFGTVDHAGPPLFIVNPEPKRWIFINRRKAYLLIAQIVNLNVKNNLFYLMEALLLRSYCNTQVRRGWLC